MPAPKPQPHTHANSNYDHTAYTLEPLRADGPDSLAADPSGGIVRITLRTIVLLWRNAFNEITIRKADDIFACAASDGKYYDAFPKGAELIQATLDFHFADAAGPHAVDISPPSAPILQHPADAPRVLSLLARRGFQAAQRAAHVLIILFALAAASNPILDTPDADDNDDDPHSVRPFSLSRGRGPG